MYLGIKADAWAAIGVWAQVLVIGLSAGFVLWQVWEARKLRQEQTRPHVVVSLQVEQRSAVMLVVENIGATVAKDVTVEFDPQPMLLDGELAVQRRPMPTLPPGMKLRSHLGQGFNLLADDYEGPREFTATVRYRDARGRRLAPDVYDLDIGIFDGYAVDLKGIHELADEVEKVRRSLERLAGGVVRVEQVETGRFGAIQPRHARHDETVETTRHGESFASRVRRGFRRWVKSDELGGSNGDD